MRLPALHCPRTQEGPGCEPERVGRPSRVPYRPVNPLLTRLKAPRRRRSIGVPPRSAPCLQSHFGRRRTSTTGRTFVRLCKVRSACRSHRQTDASLTSLVPVPLGEALCLPVGEEPRIRPAVVADGQPAVAEKDDLHCVGMTALDADRVLMVAPVCCRRGACGHLSHLTSSWYRLHGPLPLLHSRSFLRLSTGCLAIHAPGRPQ